LRTKADIFAKAAISLELEDLSEKFTSLGEKTVIAATVFAFALLLALIEYLDIVFKGSEFLGKLIRAGIYFPKKDEPEPHLWFTLLLAFLVVAIFTLAVLWLHAKMNRKAEKALQISYNSLQKSHERAQVCLTGMMDAATHIRAQQTPDASRIIKTFDKVRMIYRISKDFSAEIVREYTIRAVGQPVHFWQSSVTPSGDANPMEYLNDIRFRILDVTTPTNPTPVTYLQTENQLRHKSFCIYFLPRLEPNQPARTLQVFYVWPGYFLEAKKKKRELLEASLKSADITQSVRIEIYLEEGSGGALGCEVLSLYAHTLTPSQDTQTGWKGYAYEATNLAAGSHEHQLIAKWDPV
jgi:uncharacterized membrane protein